MDSFCSDLNGLLAESDDSVQFIEGLILTPNQYVIMTGTLTDGKDKAPNETINPIGRWHKPWFYKHGE